MGQVQRLPGQILPVVEHRLRGAVERSLALHRGKRAVQNAGAVEHHVEQRLEILFEIVGRVQTVLNFSLASPDGVLRFSLGLVKQLVRHQLDSVLNLRLRDRYARTDQQQQLTQQRLLSALQQQRGHVRDRRRSHVKRGVACLARQSVGQERVHALDHHLSQRVPEGRFPLVRHIPLLLCGVLAFVITKGLSLVMHHPVRALVRESFASHGIDQQPKS